MTLTREEMAARRERKVRQAMQQFAPIWLVAEEYRPREDSLVFDLVYDSPVNGWVKHHFKYDSFNDVLYQMGVKKFTEEEVLPIQETEPVIAGDVATRVPNEPAFRLSPPLPKAPHGV
jgi:hypothetical protein